MDNNEVIINNISIYANKILEQVEQLDINKKENILEYKLQDLLNLPLKQCIRCNKYYLPKYGNASYQLFCGSECRNVSTTENRYYNRKESKYRGMELLRKRIYEAKYNAKRFHKDLKIEDGLNELLEDLKILRKKSKYFEISNDQYEEELNDLYKQYYMWLRLNK